MLFRQFFDTQSSTYTYLLAKDYGCEAIIIDPVLQQFELYQHMIQELGVKLMYSLETHTHADHITASGKLREWCQCKIVMGEQTKAQGIDLYVHDQEIIAIDGLKIKALYTPGHTDDCYCFIVDDMVFTGDTLLIRGTGRTDFQSGDASQQYHSLFDKLLQLPEKTKVYPAHDYHGITMSTIHEEKFFNPRLQIKNEADYVKFMAQLNLPPPKMMDQAVPANLKCGMDAPSSSLR